MFEQIEMLARRILRLQSKPFFHRKDVSELIDGCRQAP